MVIEGHHPFHQDKEESGTGEALDPRHLTYHHAAASGYAYRTG